MPLKLALYILRNIVRPILDTNVAAKEFRKYYWLKTELASFCRLNGVTTQGSKKELECRIEHYLETGEKLSYKSSIDNKASEKSVAVIALDEKITKQYKNGEDSRKFFKSVIGQRFKFNVLFMKWMKENYEKTFQEAVNEWLKIEAESNSGKKNKIAPQFEYNQYMRDFFINNPQGKREDAITCWKYKKSLVGSNKYDQSDLVAIKNV